MVEQAITGFFIILFIIFIIIISLNGILNRLVDGVLSGGKTENFVSQITGLETRDDLNMVSNDDNKNVNRKIALKVHTENGYNQNNFQVPNDIPLSQTSYAYYINKYYMNKDINKSVDEDMEIVGNANIEKPDFLFDGIWKRDVKSQNDYQRIHWVPTKGTSFSKMNGEKRGKLSIDKMLEQARLKPMPEETKFSLCNLNTMPFWDYDKLCEPNMKSELAGNVNQTCDQKFKDDDIVCFPIYLDPLSK
jgi:hypothetical protein